MISFAQWGNELYSGRRAYKIIPKGRMYLIIGAVLMIASILLLVFRGLNPSIEFSGGSQMIVSGTSVSAESQDIAYEVLKKEGLTENVKVSELGTDSIRIQTQTLEVETANTVRANLAEAYDVSLDNVQTNSVGATWGQDVTRKALQSIVIFVLLVSVLMTIYFRSWTMSAAALIALAHDLMVTIGFFALTHVEVSPATVIGFLTILGYSLYDTVVVFDKIRENTNGYLDQKTYTYPELVNLGVNQTLVRSINTSVVALLPVGAILFIGSLLLGAGTLTDIALALFVGMLIGAFSSVFIAAPALGLLQGHRAKTKEHDQSVVEKRLSAGGDENTPDPEVRVSPRIPGRHLGNEAQPRRKKRGKK